MLINRHLAPEDLTSPARTQRIEGLSDSREHNRKLLNLQKIFERRTRVKFVPEVWVVFRGRHWRWWPLRGTGICLSFPSPEQAELGIKAIIDFAASLEGVILAPAPEQSVAGNGVSSQSSQTTSDPDQY